MISQTKNTVSAYVDDLIAERMVDPRFRPGMIQQKVQLELALSLVLAREKAQMSRSQLAERTNISERIISQIENGDGNPSLQTLVRLSIALHQPLSVTFSHSL
ncbi:helix-turn-helix domain-containing protein [Levilactobacillus cerevisiae]|uniref:helix-turn-helix domain-containing protein n=1 Tax=Levilactobacillus cerevisiae TaxID=1704076 RepID=UPI00345E87F4